jgi:hypothetical protein
MQTSTSRSRIFLTFAAIAAAAVPVPVQALTVEGTRTVISGGFHYEFTVDNSAGPNEVLVVTLNAPPNDALLASTLAGPGGFQTSYDPGLGLVDYLADTISFAVGSVISGFTFDSTASPPQFFTTFTALDLEAETFTGSVAFKQAPDPGSTLFFVCLGLFALGIVQCKRLAPELVVETR